MRRTLFLLALAFPASARAPAGPPAAFAIRAARIYTGDSEIENGTVLVRGGKIVAVGRQVQVPADVPVIDLPGRSLLPGLIDSETTLAEGGRDTRRSVTPEVLAADGWDFYADRRSLLAGGVTTVYVSPGSNRLVSGRGMVVKTGGHEGDIERRILRRAAGMRVTLGEYPKNPPAIYEPPIPPSPDRPFELVDVQLPSTRAGELLALRALLRRAHALRQTLRDGSVVPAAVGAGGSTRSVEPDPEAAALLDVVLGKDRLRVQVDRAHDIARTLALAAEMRVGVILEGAREAYLVPDLIARAGAPVIFRGEAQPGRTRDEDITRPTIAGQYRGGTAAALARAGVPVAIDSPTDGEVEDLLLEAAVAVREGLSPALALRAITLTAAEVLGVAGRVGSIAPGRDADLVVLPGERPFGPEEGSPLKPEAVYIEGELVYASGPREYPPDAVVIRCGRILTALEEIPGGIIVVRKGKILHVGPGALSRPPENVRVIDASREVVVPGLIDGGSRLGVHVDLLVPTLSDEGRSGPGTAGGGRATYRLADAVDPADPAIPAVLRAGITTAVITPEPLGTVSGQLTALKLSGGPRPAVVIRDHAGLLFASVRAEDLDRAHQYHDRWVAHERAATGTDPKPEPPAKDDSLEPFRPLFALKAPAVVLARSKGEIPGILRELADKHHVRVVVFGLTDVDGPALEELKKRSGAILFGSELVIRRAPPEEPLHLPRLAARSGVRFGFRSGAAAGARFLPVDVAFAVREGWNAREALRAMSLGAAQIFQIDDRVGSIEKGKDADLVFLTGDPFAVSSRVTRVMVDGAVVFEEKAP